MNIPPLRNTIISKAVSYAMEGKGQQSGSESGVEKSFQNWVDSQASVEKATK
jgi:hypothetical protein